MSVYFLKSTKTVAVPTYPALNLLAHAQLEELDIGSQCGGHGVCGGDRIKVEANSSVLSPITEIERQHLSTAEIEAGWRLGCQCWPGDARAEIRVTEM